MPMAAPVARVAPRHWVYLDEARTHEVHAEVEPGADEDRLVTTEFPAGSRDPAEAVQSSRRVTAEAEVQLFLHELETRLRLSGKYFRADAADMRWTPLGPPAAGTSVDLRAIELPIPGSDQKMAFHHFHAATEDRLLISMPRLDVDTSRHALAELTFRFPRVEAGDLRILHTRLSSATLRSAIVEEHLVLPRRGYTKLLEPADYQRVYGDDWVATTRAVFGQAASRMIQGSPDVQELIKHAGRPAPEGTDAVLAALKSGHVARLKARYLQGGEGDIAVRTGEHVIRRLVNTKRKGLPHTSAYDLSVLEAVLLLEWAVANQVWSLLEEEGEKLLRFVRGYG